MELSIRAKATDAELTRLEGIMADGVTAMGWRRRDRQELLSVVGATLGNGSLPKEGSRACWSCRSISNVGKVGLGGQKQPSRSSAARRLG